MNGVEVPPGGTITRFTVPAGMTVDHMLPVGAEIVGVGFAQDQVSFWAVCPLAGQWRSRRFLTAMSGVGVPGGARYLGTAMPSGGHLYEWHLFEVPAG